MKDFENGQSVFNNIAREEKKLRCDCAQCKFCKAKLANFVALERLSSLMKKKSIVPATVIANKLLNPGEENIEEIIASTDKKFERIEIKQIKRLVAKLRQCENKKEVIEMFKKISI